MGGCQELGLKSFPSMNYLPTHPTGDSEPRGRKMVRLKDLSYSMDFFFCIRDFDRYKIQTDRLKCSLTKHLLSRQMERK